MQMLAFTAGSLGDILATAGLAAQVVKVLYDNRNLAKECETLGIELQSLQSVLIMVEFALQRYGSTPLGEPLAQFIRPEVAQCHLSLKAFSEKVNACQQALTFTTIGSLWQKVVWAASDEAESLSAKLSNHRLKLVTLLITLTSVGWMDSGFSQLNKNQTFVHNGRCSIRGIKDNTIDVVDPLGETIPVPTFFCVTWEAFDHVLKGFSRNRAGHHYVEQGDYQIVRPDNDKLIDRSDICKLKEGETIEMSIILRSKKSNNENQGSCPRCSYLNDHAPADGGWIKCFHCSGRFQVKTVLDDEPSLAEISDGNSSSNNSSTRISEISEMKPTQYARGHDIESDIKYFRRISLEIPFFKQGRGMSEPYTIYIGGLPEHTRQEDLQSGFGKIGKIISIELKVGYGFMEFDSREAAEESVVKYHEGYFMGNRIRVELSRGGGRTARFAGDPSRVSNVEWEH